MSDIKNANLEHMARRVLGTTFRLPNGWRYHETWQTDTAASQDDSGPAVDILIRDDHGVTLASFHGRLSQELDQARKNVIADGIVHGWERRLEAAERKLRAVTELIITQQTHLPSEELAALLKERIEDLDSARRGRNEAILYRTIKGTHAPHTSSPPGAKP